jgi:hypothetical protein
MAIYDQDLLKAQGLEVLYNPLDRLLFIEGGDQNAYIFEAQLHSALIDELI